MVDLGRGGALDHYFLSTITQGFYYRSRNPLNAYVKSQYNFFSRVFCPDQVFKIGRSADFVYKHTQ